MFASFALAALAAVQSLSVPEASYPAVPERAVVAEGFAPSGWTVESEAQGDLNGDGASDLALVLRDRDPRNVIEHDGLGDNPWDTNPRMLVVAFADGAGYRRVVVDTRLIPRSDSPTQMDVLGDVEAPSIRRGSLRVSVGHWMSAGGWGMWRRTYTFRLNRDRFQLIGFDDFDLHRGSGEFTERSINYVTRRMSVTTGNVGDDRTQETWRRAPEGGPIWLEDVGDGLMFDPEASAPPPARSADPAR